MRNRLASFVLCLALAGSSLAGTKRLSSGCQRYDPTAVTVKHAGEWWEIVSRSVVIERASSQADADKIATLARHYTEECRFGDDLASTLRRPMTYWKGEQLSPLALPFPETCLTYDASSLRVENIQGGGRSYHAGRQLLFDISVTWEDAKLRDSRADALWDVAQHATSLCLIGGAQPVPPWAAPWSGASNLEPDLIDRVINRTEHVDATHDLAKWHPVFYWK